VKHDDRNSVNPWELDWAGEWSEEEKAENEEAKKKMEEAADAVVQDGSGYWAVMKTRASFGCALHEERDE
jgi:hypothetical protein